MLTIGIDDAARGPIIGPMILAGVLLNEKQEAILKKHKVRDSKQYLHNSYRIKVSSLIKKYSEKYKIVKSSPQEIDEAVDLLLRLARPNLPNIDSWVRIEAEILLNEIES